jgi:hypothetical protein
MDKEFYEEPNYEYDIIVFDSGSSKILQNENDAYTREEINSNIIAEFPDFWISENRNDIIYIFNDIKQMSQFTTFLDDCDLDEFCDYMDYVNNIDIVSKYDWAYCDINNTNNKYMNMKYPTFGQYMCHYYIELIDLFSYLTRMYLLKFGPFECFSKFVFLTSSSNRILK